MRVATQEVQILTAGLAYLTQQLQVAVEMVQIERLAHEVVASHPGSLKDMWWRWLLQTGRSVGIDLHVADVTSKELRDLARAEAVVLTLDPGTQQLASLAATRLRGYQLKPVGREDRVIVSSESEDHGGLYRIIIAEAPPPQWISQESETHQEHPHPAVLLWRMIRFDYKDYLSSLLITAVAGLLLLSVPVTAQQLVRVVTFASLYQPMIVLTLMLLGLLGFVAALQALQTYLSEVIQRKLFVRVASTVIRTLPQVAVQTWQERYLPELMNRFMDVATVQKVVSALLVDGVAILLSTCIGLGVMAFYHPFLLGYDIVLVTLMSLIFFVLGRNGVKTAILESKAKYDLQAWLEDVARCPSVFQAIGVDVWAVQRADTLCARYLHHRKAHFTVLLRQILSILALQTLATTALLGLGGYLVLQEQLTLGQLVAAELIVATITSSFAKLGKHLEGWYDLMASVDKLAMLTDLPLESRRGLVGLPSTGPASLEIRRADATAPALAEMPSRHIPVCRFDPEQDSSEGRLLSLPAGECSLLYNWDDLQVRYLIQQFRGGQTPDRFVVLIDGLEVRQYRPDIVRAQISIVGELEFFTGSIAENIHLHRPEVTEKDVRWALELTGLDEELQTHGIELSEHILPSGRPLTSSQMRRLILARGLAARPRLLVIDRLLDRFGDNELEILCHQLHRLRNHTTLLVITNQQRVVDLFQRERGQIPATRERLGVAHG